MVQTPVNMDIENNLGLIERPLSSLASDSLHFLFLQGLPPLTRRTIHLARYPSQTHNLQTSLHRWPKVTFVLRSRFF